MQTNHVCAFQDVGCPYQCADESDMVAHMQSASVAHQVASMSAFRAVMSENKELRLKQERLEARIDQMTKFIRRSGRKGSITERLVNDWHQCVRSLTVDSNHRLAESITNHNHDYWRSDGNEGSHWMRLAMRSGVMIYRLFIRLDSRFPVYRPTHVTIKTGSDPDQLTVYTHMKIPVDEDQVLIMRDDVQHHEYVQIDIQTGHGQRDCVVQGLVIIGYME